MKPKSFQKKTILLFFITLIATTPINAVKPLRSFFKVDLYSATIKWISQSKNQINKLPTWLSQQSNFKLAALTVGAIAALGLLKKYFWEQPKPTLKTPDSARSNKSDDSTHSNHSSGESKDSQAPIGSRNLGNTCYINSVIATFMYSTIFGSQSLNTQQKKIDSNPITKAWYRLAQAIHKNKQQKPLYPIELCKLITHKLGEAEIGSQQDADSAVKFIFDAFEKIKNHRSFSFHEKNTLTCLECKKTNHKYDRIQSLELPINKQEKTLNGCIQKYIREEKLDDDNKYNCHNCKRNTNHLKKIMPQNLPQLLTVNLKRNSGHWDKKQNQYVLAKDNTGISIPFTNFKPLNKDKTAYDLSGIIVHSGSARGGHYMGYSKVDNKWWRFNDSIVTPMDEQVRNDFLNKGISTNNKALGETPYILIYEKNS